MVKTNDEVNVKVSGNESTKYVYSTINNSGPHTNENVSRNSI